MLLPYQKFFNLKRTFASEYGIFCNCYFSFSCSHLITRNGASTMLVLIASLGLPIHFLWPVALSIPQSSFGPWPIHPSIQLLRVRLWFSYAFTGIDLLNDFCSADAHPQSQITRLVWLDNETVISTGQDCNTKVWHVDAI